MQRGASISSTRGQRGAGAAWGWQQIHHLIWLWTRPERSCPGQAPWQVGWRGLSKGKIPAAQEIRSFPPLAPEATSWTSARAAHKG